MRQIAPATSLVGLIIQCAAAAAMIELLNRKLRLDAEARDMVILQHDVPGA